MSEKHNENGQNVRRKTKTNKIQMRISDDELERLNIISIEDDESFSQIMRKALKVYDTLRRNKSQNYF